MADEAVLEAVSSDSSTPAQASQAPASTPSTPSAQSTQQSGSQAPGASVETAAPSLSPVLSNLLSSNFGLSPSQFQNDQQASEYLTSQFASASRYIQELQQRQAVEAQYAARHQQQAAPQEVAQGVKDGPPEYDPEWQRLVRWNEEVGRYEPLNQYVPIDIADKVNSYANHVKKVQQEFFRDPNGYIEKTIEGRLKSQAEQIEQQVLQKFQALQQKQAVRQQAMNIAQEHVEWAFQKDTAGNFLMDPYSGKPLYSPKGEAYRRATEELYADGVRDPEKINRYALAAIGHFGNSQQQADPVERRSQFGSAADPALATHTPSRGSGISNPINDGLFTPNPNSFMAMAQAEAMKQGFKIRDEY